MHGLKSTKSISLKTFATFSTKKIVKITTRPLCRRWPRRMLWRPVCILGKDGAQEQGSHPRLNSLSELERVSQA